MPVQDLAKGQTGWGRTINANFKDLEDKLDALETRQVDRPDTDKAGLVFHLADGTTTVKTPVYSEKYTYGFVYDETDPNPQVTYTDDCAAFVPAHNYQMGTWSETKLYESIFPCTLREDGTVLQYLDRNNFNRITNGTSAVLNGSKGDVMIRFPKIYWDFQRTGSQVYVRIGNYRFSETAVCYAHRKGMEEKDDLYIGAYLAPMGSWASSISGATVTEGSFSVFSSYIRNSSPVRRSRFLYSFYPHLLLQILAVLFYGTRDLQYKLGMGVLDLSKDYRTGVLNDKPFCWGYEGENDGIMPVKFLGIENWYGYKAQLMAGLASTQGKKLWRVTLNPELYDMPEGEYGFQQEYSVPYDATAFTREAVATNEFGFLPKMAEGGGSGSFFCDTMHMKSGGVFVSQIGGWASSGMEAGPFCISLSCPITGSGGTTVGRIIQL